MENGKVELAAGGQTLAEVKMQRGIMQGGSLLSLLFAIEMVPLSYELRKRSGATHLQNYKKI